MPDPKKPSQQDNECMTCTGVSYFSGALRAQSSKPICFGISSKSKHRIPKDRMLALEKHPAIKPNAKVYQIGVSQSSVRMNKTGKVPILIFGVEINVMAEDPAPINKEKPTTAQMIQKQLNDDLRKLGRKESGTANDKASAQNRSNGRGAGDGEGLPNSDQNKIPAGAGAAGAVGMPVGLLSLFSIENLFDAGRHVSGEVYIFGNRFFRSSQRQWTSMGRNYDRITDKLPERMQRSSSRLITSAGTTWNQMIKTIYKYASGPDSDK